MRNPRAFWAIVTALLSLAALAGAALAGRMFSDVVGLYEAMPAVPVALVLALGEDGFDHVRLLGVA